MKKQDSGKNIESMQKTIDKTINNMEVAEEVITQTDDTQMKKSLKEKNVNRTEAIRCMKKGIKSENLEIEDKPK